MSNEAELADLEKRTKAALRKLNSKRTVPKIASYLREQSIQGQRNYSPDCPVARYLQKELGITQNDIEVYPDMVVVMDGEDEWGGRESVTLPTPAVVSSFIDRFDNEDPKLADLAVTEE